MSVEYSGNTKKYVRLSADNAANLKWIKSVVAKSKRDDGQMGNITSTGEAGTACIFRDRPESTFTCFYRRLDNSSIIVVGIGERDEDGGRGNVRCKVRWADGRKRTVLLKRHNFKRSSC